MKPERLGKEARDQTPLGIFDAGQKKTEHGQAGDGILRDGIKPASFLHGMILIGYFFILANLGARANLWKQGGFAENAI
jgi:hypothetical protein